MIEGDNLERELRAARNQAMFRAINEKMAELSRARQAISETNVIACECASAECAETLSIAPDEYEAVRKHPNRFAVLPGHAYADVESIVDEHAAYVVVEKVAAASAMTEALYAGDTAGRRH